MTVPRITFDDSSRGSNCAEARAGKLQTSARKNTTNTDGERSVRTLQRPMGTPVPRHKFTAGCSSVVSKSLPSELFDCGATSRVAQAWEKAAKDALLLNLKCAGERARSQCALNLSRDRQHPAKPT